MSFEPSLTTALKRAYDAIGASDQPASRKQTRTNNVIVGNAIAVGENRHLRNVTYNGNKGIMKLLVNHSSGQNNETEERRLQEMAAKVGLAPEVFALCGFDFYSFISQSILSDRGRPTAKDFPIDIDFECEGNSIMSSHTWKSPLSRNSRSVAEPGSWWCSVACTCFLRSEKTPRRAFWQWALLRNAMEMYS